VCNSHKVSWRLESLIKGFWVDPVGPGVPASSDMGTVQEHKAFLFVLEFSQTCCLNCSNKPFIGYQFTWHVTLMISCNC